MYGIDVFSKKTIALLFAVSLTNREILDPNRKLFDLCLNIKQSVSMYSKHLHLMLASRFLKLSMTQD